jgi:hypothetical protein
LNGIPDLHHLQQHDHSDSDHGQAKRNRELTDSGSPPKQMKSTVSQPQADDTNAHAASRNAPKPAPRVAGKKRRAPNDSSDAAKAATNIAPVANGMPRSRSESDVSEKAPRRKKRKTAAAVDTPQDAADAPPELTDASTPPGSPEPIPDVAPRQIQNVLPNVNGEMPAKTAKRLPGRRRQPHSNINVEVKLRRQLHLKMDYRTVAKFQKDILAEIAKRELGSLKNDPDYHKQSPYYGQVMAGLNERFQQRKRQLDYERKAKLDELERVRVAEEYIQRRQFIVSVFASGLFVQVLTSVASVSRVSRELPFAGLS